MDEELGLLDAIAEQPDADHDRRVYADWLEDRGEGPRAEFVRLQLALARLGEDQPARTALMTRERGLLVHHEQAWTLGLRHLVDGWTFRRGFVEEVVIQRPLTAGQYDELFAWPFVRRISAPRQAWRLFPGLVESEGARRLEALHLAHSMLEPRHFRDLFECPRFDRLRTLTIDGCQFDFAAMRRLTKSPLLGQLSSLVLCGSFGTQGGILLARSSHLGLRRLNLTGAGLGGDAALALASAPLLAGLTSLSLCDNHFGNESISSLIRCPHFRGLSELDLSVSRHLADADVWSELYGHSGPQRLSRLALRNNGLFRSQLFDLLSSPRLDSLRSLDLARCRLVDDGSSWTGPQEVPSTPLHLNLSRAYPQGTDLLEELFLSVPALRRVERLDLEARRAEEADLTALFASPHLERLRWLNLATSAGVDDLVGSLCSSKLSRQLTAIDLSDCHLTDSDAVSLARDFPHLANLTWLSLRSNHIGSRGARALAESPYLRDLRHLDLSDNDIDDEGAFHLARAEHLASPVVLDVSGNDIGTEGMAALLGAAERAFERGVSIPFFDA